MNYKALDFNSLTGSLRVNFFTDSYPEGLTFNIDIPIVDGQYISGNDLEAHILAFAPHGQIDRIVKLRDAAPPPPNVQLSKPEPAPLTLASFQRAHDQHINAPAIARRYDNFATFSLRAFRAGPWQAEAIVFFDWMESTNAAGYEILAKVQAGTMPIPESTDAYIAMLPPLPSELVLS